MPVTIVQTLRERAAARAAERGRGAARQALLLLPLLAAVLLAYVYRAELFGLDEPVRLVGLFAVVLLGWAFARSVGRALGPVLFRRFSPSTAGTLGFFIRLATLAAVVVVALYVAGFSAQELVLGGAFAAAILGLAGQ